MPSLKKDYAEKGLRTLGPVSDLERHLPADWWKTLFNAVYHYCPKQLFIM